MRTIPPKFRFSSGRVAFFYVGASALVPKSQVSHGRDAKSITYLGQKVPCYEFGSGDSWSFAPKLKHPGRGFSAGQWHPVVLKALARAGGHEFRM
jgi:hypothetical protein